MYLFECIGPPKVNLRLTCTEVPCTEVRTASDPQSILHFHIRHRVCRTRQSVQLVFAGSPPPCVSVLRRNIIRGDLDTSQTCCFASINSAIVTAVPVDGRTYTIYRFLLSSERTELSRHRAMQRGHSRKPCFVLGPALLSHVSDTRECHCDVQIRHVDSPKWSLLVPSVEPTRRRLASDLRWGHSIGSTGRKSDFKAFYQTVSTFCDLGNSCPSKQHAL